MVSPHLRHTHSHMMCNRASNYTLSFDILAWVIWDKTDNEDVEDSNEECEDYGCVVQLCRLLHDVLHVDVQSSLRNEAKTDKYLRGKVIKISTTIFIHSAYHNKLSPEE